MENKDIFDWIGLIGGILAIIDAMLGGIIAKIKKINELDKKNSPKRKRRKK
ncbi:MAG: hypothetical protein J6M62_09270 [Selenomonadaceae bacterium]|nr:hypothetical protein [Selenomonadaceae bacterium]